MTTLEYIINTDNIREIVPYDKESVIKYNNGHYVFTSPAMANAISIKRRKYQPYIRHNQIYVMIGKQYVTFTEYDAEKFVINNYIFNDDNTWTTYTPVNVENVVKQLTNPNSRTRIVIKYRDLLTAGYNVPDLGDTTKVPPGETEDGVTYTITENKYQQSKNDEDLRKRVFGLIVPYNAKNTIDNPRYELVSVSDQIEELYPEQDLPRIAKFKVENCAIALARIVQPKKMKHVYNLFPELKPEESQNTNYVYIDEPTLRSIARKLKIHFTIYSLLGERANLKPWKIIGDKKQAGIKMVVSNNHGRMVDNFKLSKTIVGPIVSNDDTAQKQTEEIIHKPNIIPKRVVDGIVEAYVEVTNGIAVMYKSFDHPESESHPYVYTIEAMLSCLWKKKHQLKPITSNSIREFVKSSSIFIGSRRFEDKVISTTRDTSTHASAKGSENNSAQKYDYIQFDANRCYSSYESNPYYCGFPSHNLIPQPYVNQEFAFARVKVQSAPKIFYHFTECDPSATQSHVITWPIYRWLLDRNAVVEVEYVLIDINPITDASINTFISEQTGLDYDSKEFKRYANQIIGATIAGGLQEQIEYEFQYANEQEKLQLVHEAQENNLPYKYMNDVDSPTGALKIRVDTNKHGIFQFHTYILSYAAITMMDMWLKLEANESTLLPIGHIVDAIICRVLVENNYQELIADKRFKLEQPKEYFWSLSKTPFAGQSKNTCKSLQVPDWALPYECDPTLLRENNYTQKSKHKSKVTHCIRYGFAGVGKSYEQTRCPVDGSIFTVPTHELKRGCNYVNTNQNSEKYPVTLQKYVQWQMSVEDWQRLRAEGKIPRRYPIVFIDEAGQYDTATWKEIYHRVVTIDKSIIIATFGPHQIRKCIHSEPISLEWFKDLFSDPFAKSRVAKVSRESVAKSHSRNIQTIFIPRDENIPARHTYEYGCKLDLMAVSDYQTQIRMCKELYTTITFDEFNKLIDTQIVDINHKFVSGSHSRLALVGKRLVDAFGPGHYNVKTQKNKVALVSRDNVYFKKSMSDTIPEGKGTLLFTSTADSLQGLSIDHKIYVDAQHLYRDGTLYSTVTRPRLQSNVVIII